MHKFIVTRTSRNNLFGGAPRYHVKGVFHREENAKRWIEATAVVIDPDAVPFTWETDRSYVSWGKHEEVIYAIEPVEEMD